MRMDISTKSKARHFSNLLELQIYLNAKNYYFHPYGKPEKVQG